MLSPPERLSFTQDIDGFTLVAAPASPPLVGTVVFVVVSFAALLGSAWGLVEAAMYTESVLRGPLGWLGVSAVAIGGLAAAVWGTGRVMAALDRWTSGPTEAISLRGTILSVGPRRVPLADVLFVEQTGDAVRLVLRGGERLAVGHAMTSGERDWLLGALQSLLPQRGGSPEDVPQGLRSLQAIEPPVR